MKPGYSIEEQIDYGNEIILCLNWSNLNLVGLYSYPANWPYTESSSIVAIFKIKYK